MFASLTSLMTQLTLIVATDLKGGIGLDNSMPWRLPEDMAHFKSVTTGHPVIMGRKTFDSIGKPLPQRRNIVITRNPNWRHAGVEAVDSLAAALALVTDTAAFIIGGAQIYAQAMPLADQLIITEINATFECDAFFPEHHADQWDTIERLALHSERASLDYAFVTKRRQRAARDN